MGKLFEMFTGELELAVYGYFSNTKYKYLMIRNENKQTTGAAQKPSDSIMKTFFKNLQRIHTEHIVNPFFDGNYSEENTLNKSLITKLDELIQ